MAYCENCGNDISDQAYACPKCGHPRASRGPAGATAARRTEGTAIASLVLGILGIVMCPLILSIAAIVLGSQAKAKIAAERGLEGEQLAKAGIVLGWIGVAWGVLVMLVFFGSFASVRA
jgi:uncharacterized membrane protein YvbJ